MKKDIFGFEGLYYAKQDGSIWSYGGKTNHKNDIQLKKSIDKDGYYRVTLQNNKIKKYFRVNRLIALTFIDNKDNKPFVNHIDKNKQNDNVNNLEWVTAFENWKHSENEMKNKSIKVAKVSISTDEVIEVYETLMDAARCNNINQGNITNCIKGRCKTVGGFKWKIF